MFGVPPAPQFLCLPAPAPTTYHVITGALTNFTARRRLPRRRAPARLGRLSPAALQGQGARAERGVEVRAGGARGPPCTGALPAPPPAARGAVQRARERHSGDYASRRAPRRRGPEKVGAGNGRREESTVTFPIPRREEALGLQLPSDSALKGAARARGDRRRVSEAAVARAGEAVTKDRAPRRLPSAAAAPLSRCSARRRPSLAALPWPLPASLPSSGERGGGRKQRPEPAAVSASFPWAAGPGAALRWALGDCRRGSGDRAVATGLDLRPRGRKVELPLRGAPAGWAAGRPPPSFRRHEGAGRGWSLLIFLRSPSSFPLPAFPRERYRQAPPGSRPVRRGEAAAQGAALRLPSLSGECVAGQRRPCLGCRAGPGTELGLRKSVGGGEQAGVGRPTKRYGRGSGLVLMAGSNASRMKSGTAVSCSGREKSGR